MSLQLDPPTSGEVAGSSRILRQIEGGSVCVPALSIQASLVIVVDERGLEEVSSQVGMGMGEAGSSVRKSWSWRGSG